MTATTVEPPAPPADPKDPTATLMRKLVGLRNCPEFSPRMTAIVGDILNDNDKEWSVPLMEPIMVVDGQVSSAGDNVYSVDQVEVLLDRLLLKLSLTADEASSWRQKFRTWKS